MVDLDWFAGNVWALWLVLFLLLAVIEMLSLDLYFIMLGVGTLGGIAVSLTGGPLWLQFVAFSVVSLLMILFARPIAMRQLKKSRDGFRSNIERLIGSEALAVDQVSVLSGTAKINGEIWSARTDVAGVEISSGSTAVVQRIEGATAFLAPNP